MDRRERRRAIAPRWAIAAQVTLTVATTFAILFAAPRAQAEDYPTRPVCIIVGFIPGSAADPLSGGPEDFARHIAGESKRWGDVAAAAGLKK